MLRGFNTLASRTAQEAIIFAVRPYVRRELPGWGKVYNLVANYHRDWLWMSAPVKTTAGRLHGHTMRLDLSKWSDRLTYFLGRWSNLELQLFLADNVRPGDTVVDGGANRGNFALFASNVVGSAGEVMCYEPNPQCLKTLRGDIEANGIRNITVHPVGLGSSEGEMSLSVPAINAGEGTLGRSAYETARVILVKIEQGDKTLAQKTPNLIKLDVEGFECKALAGLERTIVRCHPTIITEVVSRHLAACDSSVEGLLTFMSDLGYQGYRLRLVKRKQSHTWQLTKFDPPSDDNVDVVWAHRLTSDFPAARPT